MTAQNSDNYFTWEVAIAALPEEPVVGVVFGPNAT